MNFANFISTLFIRSGQCPPFHLTCAPAIVQMKGIARRYHARQRIQDALPFFYEKAAVPAVLGAEPETVPARNLADNTVAAFEAVHQEYRSQRRLTDKNDRFAEADIVGAVGRLFFILPGTGELVAPSCLAYGSVITQRTGTLPVHAKPFIKADNAAAAVLHTAGMKECQEDCRQDKEEMMELFHRRR